MTPMITTFDAALPNGITLACRAAGPEDAPCIVFLHGFPEAAFVWDEVMSRLAARFRCIAPDLRGFGASSAPPEVEAYRAKVLVGDLVGLVQHLGGAPLAMLVAHDWGGAVAWNLAAQKPLLLDRLLMINSPHPATFLRELRHNPAQQQASAYMNFLCRPDAAALLAENGYARLFGVFGDAAWLDEPTKARYRDVWNRGLEGALNYYRASPLKPPTKGDDEVMTLQLPPGFGTVTVPTQVLWGEADTALLPGLLDGLEGWLPHGRVRRVPGASHWIVHEQPALVADTIERWMAAEDPRPA